MSIRHILSEIKEHFNNRPIKIAELGILYGEGIPFYLNNLNVEEYVGVDLFDCYDDNRDDSYELMKNHGLDIKNKLIKKYEKDLRVKFDVGFTNKVVNNYPDNYFDLIFIDAGHETPQITEDIRLWYPKMKSNGIFSGDDYFYPPVRNAVVDFVNKTENQLYNSLTTNLNFGPWSWYVKVK